MIKGTRGLTCEKRLKYEITLLQLRGDLGGTCQPSVIL